MELDEARAQVKSLSTQQEAVQSVAKTRAVLGEMVKRMTDEAVWDSIKSRDVPPELTDFVSARLESGSDPYDIRKELGISSVQAKSWVKIMSSIKAGVRIDGTSLLKRKGWEYQHLSQKLLKQIDNAIEVGIPTLTKDGDIVHLKGPTKELAALIDTFNKLSQGFVKLGKDLGAFVEGDQGKGGQGVTIVVNTMVPLPKQKDIDAEIVKNREATAELMEQAKDSPVEAPYHLVLPTK